MGSKDLPQPLQPHENRLTEPQTSDVQARFEHLISRAKIAGNLVSEPAATLTHPTLGTIYEEAYAVYRGQLPEVGVKWQLPNAELTFHLHMYKGRPPSIGKSDNTEDIICAETRIQTRTQDHATSGLNFGDMSIFLSRLGDQVMLQAAANAINQPVLHTVTCDRFASQASEQRAQELFDEGYVQKKGYFDAFDKIYSPQISK